MKNILEVLILKNLLIYWYWSDIFLERIWVKRQAARVVFIRVRKKERFPIELRVLGVGGWPRRGSCCLTVILTWFPLL